MATRSVAIAQVVKAGGALHVRKANKQGHSFTSAQQVLDIIDDAESKISDELLIAWAIKKVGAANADNLAGKVVTLRVELDII